MLLLERSSAMSATTTTTTTTNCAKFAGALSCLRGPDKKPTLPNAWILLTYKGCRCISSRHLQLFLQSFRYALNCVPPKLSVKPMQTEALTNQFKMAFR
jgi:hypothetical protein